MSFSQSIDRRHVAPLLSVFLLLYAAAGRASAGYATFDSFAQGQYGTTLTDGGITFADQNRYVPGEPSGYAWSIDQRSRTSDSFYSAPNVLSFGSFVQDSNPDAYFRIGSFSMTPDVVSSSLQLELFIGDDSLNTGNVVLDLYRNGQVVGTSTTSIPVGHNANLYAHYRIEASTAGFDRAVFTAHGSPSAGGAMFGYVDNVRTNPVPEPATLVALTLGVGCFRRRRVSRK